MLGRVPSIHATTTNQTSTLTTNPLVPLALVHTTPTTMSMTYTLPKSYRQVLLRDRHAAQFTDGHPSPRSRVAGHLLAPFLTVPQFLSVDKGMDTTMESSPGRGLQSPDASTPRCP
jgi:hypothetical protein